MLRHEVSWEPHDLPRLMEQAKRPLVIHKRRQTGGTTELLRFAQKRCGARFVVISPNTEMARQVRGIWHKENGFAITLFGEDIPEPAFISVGDIEHMLRGGPTNQFVVVDEWNRLTDQQQGNVLDYGKFKMAVTS